MASTAASPGVAEGGEAEEVSFEVMRFERWLVSVFMRGESATGFVLIFVFIIYRHHHDHDGGVGGGPRRRRRYHCRAHSWSRLSR